MSTSAHGSVETCRLGYDLACELLEHIRLGRTIGTYSAAEIAEVEAERDRCKAWLDDHEASQGRCL